MIWLYIPILIALSALAYLGGRGLAKRRVRATGLKAHSRPSQHGYYALIWVGMPALVVLILAGVFSEPIGHQTLAAGAPDGVAQLEPFRREAFFADARLVGQGRQPQQIWPAPLAEQLAVEGRRADQIRQTLTWGGLTVESTPGEGASFNAYFPMATERPEPGETG